MTALPPPTVRFTLLGWLYKNLFNNWYNSLLTVVSGLLIYLAARGFFNWALNSANWEVVQANLRLFMVGQYPLEETWRVWLVVAVCAALIGLSLALWSRRRILALVFLLIIPLAFMLLPAGQSVRPYLVGLAAAGGFGWLLGRYGQKRLRRPAVFLWAVYLVFVILMVRGLGEESALLPRVPSNLWGGLLLTFLLTVVGIVFSFPIGVLLAVGRRSKLPVIRWFCVGFIEVVRGVPLITILFMAQLMLPLFLPGNVTVDRVIRAMVGIVLFSAAYLAENVRGGLQAIPNGQYEAAHALGLSGFQTNFYIILPQALRAVIPILVGQFISLFKDTSLVAIVGLLDLLGIARTVLAQPAFIGLQIEVFTFISVIYFIFSYAMSAASQRLESALGVGER